jgi:threonine/homoserine/homoserine lactone efflux protein
MMLYFFQGAAFALSATIMPGPFQAFLLSRSLQYGWKRTLPAALAPLVTDGPIIILVMIVLTQLPRQFPDMLQIAGGLFILYLAKGIFVSLKAVNFVAESSGDAARKSLLQAIIMNALNPNPYIFWSVVGGPIILSGWRESPGLGLSFIVGFFGTFVCGLVVLIVAFATAGRINPKANQIMRGVAAVALVGFGIYLIASGVEKFL